MHNLTIWDKLIIVHENQYILEQRKSKVREAIETRKGVSIMTTFINNAMQQIPFLIPFITISDSVKKILNIK